MASEMAVVEAVPKYSSTTNAPAMSAFKWASPLLLLAIQLCVNVLSVIAVAIVPVLVTAPFTDIEYPLLDALYCTTTVNHEFCTINAAVATLSTLLFPTPLKISTSNDVLDDCLATSMLLVPN
jgi:hypothetical protein